jgi:hypothetical protein
MHTSCFNLQNFLMVPEHTGVVKCAYDITLVIIHEYIQTTDRRLAENISLFPRFFCLIIYDGTKSFSDPNPILCSVRTSEQGALWVSEN